MTVILTIFALATIGSILVVLFSSPETRANALFGFLNPEVICPHCQVKGQVRMKDDTVKGWISGAKVAGAIMTSGLSLPVTGLSQKNKATRATCRNCQVSWTL